MHVTEKLTRPLTEAKYLNADNADRYRSIMRIFYENYEKLRYWMYQDEAEAFAGVDNRNIRDMFRLMAEFPRHRAFKQKIKAYM